ncbi:alpha/beta fold hydrolase [Halofilum ochraceum]|uniref:alpha/beta fold hydrolase n=1 Tax=Halofilum ochraceum TaxID=1611323 RepID=UPI0008DAA313|nr:alpha/beta hydrolase [Halofilum ochraceum]
MLTLDRTFDFHGDAVAWGWIKGPDTAPPAVLIHGFPWSAQAWRRIAPWLARERSVYYFDMLGCGQSAKHAEQDVSPAVQNELLANLIDHWGLSKPLVVAHDFGGLAALRGHFLSGIEYSALYLIDAVSVLPSGSPFFAHAKEHFEAFAETPGFTHDALFRAFVNFGSLHGLLAETIDMYAAPWRGDVGQPAFYRQILHSGSGYIQEVQDCYAPVAFPVHLVWGEHDDNIPVSQGRELADALNADSFTVVPDAAHIVMEDAPEAVVAALLGARDGRA